MRWLFTKTKVVAHGTHPFYMRIGPEKVSKAKKRFFLKKGSSRMGDAFQIAKGK